MSFFLARTLILAFFATIILAQVNKINSSEQEKEERKTRVKSTRLSILNGTKLDSDGQRKLIRLDDNGMEMGQRKFRLPRWG